jgi:5-methylcytosine-specific restriction endonuclease McrA
LSLKPLPADPQPTEEDLAAVKNRLQEVGRYSKRTTRHVLAFEWRQQVKSADPNAFHVPFRPKEVDYDAYLASALWKQIRQSVLNNANRLCAGCGAKATRVHHRDYRPRVLSGADITPLVALCVDCHDFVHKDKRKTWQEEDCDLIALVADYEATHGENSN